MNEYRWSLGTLIGLPVAGLVLLVAVSIAVFGFWRVNGRRELGLGFAGLALAGFTVLTTAICYWPFDSEYHQWRNTSGTVEAIDSRLLSTGDNGPTERFVVTFDDGRQRSCDDTRCAQVKEGDDLTLACKRAWQWSGTHGYDCSYIAHEAAAR